MSGLCFQPGLKFVFMKKRFFQTPYWFPGICFHIRRAWQNTPKRMPPIVSPAISPGFPAFSSHAYYHVADAALGCDWSCWNSCRCPWTTRVGWEQREEGTGGNACSHRLVMQRVGLSRKVYFCDALSSVLTWIKQPPICKLSRHEPEQVPRANVYIST